MKKTIIRATHEDFVFDAQGEELAIYTFGEAVGCKSTPYTDFIVPG